MSQITCPDCKHIISDTASTCPKCGGNVTVMFNNQLIKIANEQKQKHIKNIILFIVFCISLYLYITFSKPTQYGTNISEPIPIKQEQQIQDVQQQPNQQIESKTEIINPVIFNFMKETTDNKEIRTEIENSIIKCNFDTFHVKEGETINMDFEGNYSVFKVSSNNGDVYAWVDYTPHYNTAWGLSSYSFQILLKQVGSIWKVLEHQEYNDKKWYVGLWNKYPNLPKELFNEE